MPKSEESSQLNELTKYLKANLLLQLTNLPKDKSDNVKPELLLYRAGFTYTEIADLLGKNYKAVEKFISRAKKKNKEDEA